MNIPNTITVVRILAIPVFMIVLMSHSPHAQVWAPFILSPKPLVVGIGLLFALLGNYLGKLRNNFFVGVRTPWTLSSDTVWRKTHRLAGWMFVIGGLIAAFAGLVVSPDARLYYVVLAVLLASALVPVLYSYLIFRKEAE